MFVCLLLLGATLSSLGTSYFITFEQDISKAPNISDRFNNDVDFNEVEDDPPPVRMASDNWRMFQHDPKHTGFSSSFTPEVNNTLWINETGDSIVSSPAVVNGHIYFGSGIDGKFYCLDANSGTEQWVTQIGAGIKTSPAIFPKLNPSNVCFGSDDGKVHCLYLFNGAEAWSFTTGYNSMKSSPTEKAGRVYIGSGVFNTTTSTYDGVLHCLNRNTGVEYWNFTIPNGLVFSSPAVFSGNVYFGSANGRVYCVDIYTGVEQWNYTTDGSVESSPAIQDNKIYIGSDDGKIYCLNATTGDEIWNKSLSYSVKSSPAVVDGCVYIGSYEKVYCFNGLNGSQIWEKDLPIGTYGMSSPAIADGKLYIGSDSGYIYCLNLTDNGTILWDYLADGSTCSSPSIAQDSVFMGSSNGTVYCFRDEFPPNYLAIGNATAHPADTDILIPITGRWSGEMNWFWTKISFEDYDPPPYEPIYVEDVTISVEGSVDENPSEIYCQYYLYGNKWIVEFWIVYPPEYWSPCIGLGLPPGEGLLCNLMVDIKDSAPNANLSLDFYGFTEFSWTFNETIPEASIFLDELFGGYLNIVNFPPSTPVRPDGPTSGSAGVEYAFSTNASDPDGQQIRYGWDWDGSLTVDEWTPFYDSGVNISTDHIWAAVGTFEIRVKAQDPAGNESNWSLPLSISITNEPPNTPFRPVGPTSGGVGLEYNFSTNATDPDGGIIRYGWDWDGDQVIDEWTGFYASGENIITSHIWAEAFNGEIRVKAQDPTGAESDWSLPLAINITNEPPDTPFRPVGPTSGGVGFEYNFSTNTTDPDGQQIRYGWDWDGSLTVDEWTGFYASGENIITSHIWAEAFNGEIRVKAQDPTGAESDWSLPLAINITNEPPDTPAQPSGPTFGEVGIEYSYSTNTTDPEDHLIQYGWDWDGDQIVDKLSGGSANLGEMFYDGFETGFSLWDENGATNWDKVTDQKYAGLYAARCRYSDTYLTSDNIDTSTYNIFGISFWFYDRYIDDNEALLQLWNGTAYVTIQDLNIVQHTENQWTYYETVIEDPEYMSSTFRVRFDGTELDSPEYLWIDEFKVGAFCISGENISVNHTWFERGLYNVSVRAKDQYNATSPWSEPLSVYIHNDEPVISKPDGQIALKIGESALYITSAEDPNGHQVQYRFDWDDGTCTEWTALADSGQVVSVSHSWILPGTHMVKAQARDEFNLTSEWSDGLMITVTAGDWWPWWSMFRHDPLNIGYSPSLGPVSNNVTWTSELDGSVQSSSPAVVDDKVYVSFESEEPGVYCFNAINGEEIWMNHTESFGRSPAVADGRVFVGAGETLYCWDAQTGVELWKNNTNGGIYVSPVVVDDRVYIASWFGELYCFNVLDGTKIWSKNVGYGVHFTMSSPAVADGKIFIGSTEGMNGKVYCFNASNGEVLWTFSPGGDVKSSPAFAYSNIYVGADNGMVYCLDASSGQLKWEFETGADFYVRSSPAISNGYVYIGSANHKIYCLHAFNGTEKWAYDTGTFVYSSPLIADGKLYIGHLASSDNNIRCFNASDGSEIWNYSTGGAGTWSSPAIAQGKLYIGELGKIHCFGSNLPPETPDPPFGPDEGVVDEEYTFFVELPIDPQGEPFSVLWDWGDGNFSSWMGPYGSGETACALHTWTKIGNYEIRVKIEDTYGVQSSWTDPFPIDIVESACIEIIDIKGGFGLKVFVENTGGGTATDLRLTVTVEDGLYVYNRNITYVIGNIDDGESIKVPIQMFGIGLGIFTDLPTITLTADSVDTDTIEESISAMIIGPFVILR